MSWFKRKHKGDVQRLFEAFLEYSTEGAKSICELQSVSGVDPTGDFPEPISISNRISIEFVLFYIYLLNRTAYRTLPEKSRLKMVADFVDRTVRALPAASDAHRTEQPGNKYGVWYFSQFIARQDEYCQFENLISEEPSEPTAFQRFGENLGRLFGEDQYDRVSMPCQAYIVESLKHIDLEGFVTSMPSIS